MRNIFLWMLPFAAIILLMGMHYRADGFLLERMRSDGAIQAGIYAAAYRLLDAANMIGYLTASFLLPFIARNKGNSIVLTKVTKNVQNLLLMIAVSATCFVLVFPSWVQQILYYTSNDFTDRVLQLCLAVLPAYYLIHVYGSVLTALGKFKPFIIILAGCVLANLAINIILIPVYGAVGCCIAALVSQYACAAGCYLTASRHLSSPVSGKHWLTGLLLAGSIFCFFFLLKFIIASVWIILVLVVILFSAILAIRLKLFKSLFRTLIPQKNA